MLINQLTIMNVSLEEQFCLDATKSTLDYLNSPVASTLLTKDDILARKLVAWNEMKAIVFDKFLTTVTLIPLLYLLNLIQLSVVSREKDRLEKSTTKPKTIMNDIKDFFLRYLASTDCQQDFVDRTPHLRDEEIDLYFTLSKYLLQNAGLTRLIEAVQRISSSLFLTLSLDQKLTRDELGDIFQAFLDQFFLYVSTESM